LRKKTESVSDFTAWDGAPSSTGRVESRGGPLLRIALESFLIAGRRMIRPQSTRKAQMKTILMLIVGLMLASCGSMENHVRNRHKSGTIYRTAEMDAVDTICACP
jgi:hypothetical protein